MPANPLKSQPGSIPTKPSHPAQWPVSHHAMSRDASSARQPVRPGSDAACGGYIDRAPEACQQTFAKKCSDPTSSSRRSAPAPRNRGVSRRNARLGSKQVKARSGPDASQGAIRLRDFLSGRRNDRDCHRRLSAQDRRLGAKGDHWPGDRAKSRPAAAARPTAVVPFPSGGSPSACRHPPMTAPIRARPARARAMCTRVSHCSECRVRRHAPL
jgi:hypothetical protein